MDERYKMLLTPVSLTSSAARPLLMTSCALRTQFKTSKSKPVSSLCTQTGQHSSSLAAKQGPLVFCIDTPQKITMG
eukprot:1156794-Pelagomonas_calceolata.AAC.4